MNTLVLLPFLFSITFTTTHSLSCVPCDMWEGRCTPEDELNCKGGLAWAICGCCKECAKTIGESCGGDWGMDGTCDVGLKCVTLNNSELGIYLFHQTGTCWPKMTEA